MMDGTQDFPCSEHNGKVYLEVTKNRRGWTVINGQSRLIMTTQSGISITGQK